MVFFTSDDIFNGTGEGERENYPRETSFQYSDDDGTSYSTRESLNYRLMLNAASTWHA